MIVAHTIVIPNWYYIMLSWEGNYIIKRGWGLRKNDDKKTII